MPRNLDDFVNEPVTQAEPAAEGVPALNKVRAEIEKIATENGTIIHRAKAYPINSPGAPVKSVVDYVVSRLRALK